MTYKDRKIEMDGAPNFRELGGIVNKQGRTVCKGLLFRSGSLNKLSPNDWEKFTNLGIKTVIDFRSHNEIKNDPDNIPHHIGAKYIQSTIGNPADMEGLFMNPKEIRKEDALAFTITGYRKFIHAIEDFKPIFDSLSTDRPINEPFLFHCMAGKDRTGIAAALILLTLDVDRDIIIDDYLLSNKYALPYFLENKKHLGLSDFRDEVIQIIGGVDAKYLQTSFDVIDSLYGNIEGLLSQIFGITPEQRNKIIENYTY